MLVRIYNYLATTAVLTTLSFLAISASWSTRKTKSLILCLAVSALLPAAARAEENEITIHSIWPSPLKDQQPDPPAPIPDPPVVVETTTQQLKPSIPQGYWEERWAEHPYWACVTAPTRFAWRKAVRPIWNRTGQLVFNGCCDLGQWSEKRHATAFANLVGSLANIGTTTIVGAKKGGAR